jgi:hypothetical protein
MRKPSLRSRAIGAHPKCCWRHPSRTRGRWRAPWCAMSDLRIETMSIGHPLAGRVDPLTRLPIALGEEFALCPGACHRAYTLASWEFAHWKCPVDGAAIPREAARPSAPRAAAERSRGTRQIRIVRVDRASPAPGAAAAARVFTPQRSRPPAAASHEAPGRLRTWITRTGRRLLDRITTWMQPKR